MNAPYCYSLNLIYVSTRFLTCIMCIFFVQVDTMKKYFPVFDQLRKEFLVGEMTWTFADYDVLEC